MIRDINVMIKVLIREGIRDTFSELYSRLKREGVR